MQIILIFSNQILIGGRLLQTAPSPVEESQISECTFYIQSNVKRMEQLLSFIYHIHRRSKTDLLLHLMTKFEFVDELSLHCY